MSNWHRKVDPLNENNSWPTYPQRICRIAGSSTDRLSIGAPKRWQRKTYVIVGVMDLRSRKLLTWDLLRPLKPKPTAAVLTSAMSTYGNPPALVVGIDEVFKSADVQAIYAQAEVWPVDLRQGKASVSIFIRSLWRNLEWEGLSWRELADEPSFRQVVADWLMHYNRERPTQALGYEVPDERWRSARYQL